MTRKATDQLLDELFDVSARLFSELNQRNLVNFKNPTPESKAYLDTYQELTFHHCFITVTTQGGLELSDSDYSTAVETLDAGRKAYRKLASTK